MPLDPTCTGVNLWDCTKIVDDFVLCLLIVSMPLTRMFTWPRQAVQDAQMVHRVPLLCSVIIANVSGQKVTVTTDVIPSNQPCWPRLAARGGVNFLSFPL